MEANTLDFGRRLFCYVPFKGDFARYHSVFDITRVVVQFSSFFYNIKQYVIIKSFHPDPFISY